jgi:lysophospholipase L1-like esterase
VGTKFRFAAAFHERQLFGSQYGRMTRWYSPQPAGRDRLPIVRNSSLPLFLSCLILAILTGCKPVDKTESSSPNVLFLGDSMAAGLSTNQQQGKRVVYTAYAWKNEFKNADVRGISGATLDVVMTEMTPQRASAVVIFAGYNSIWHMELSEDNIADQYSHILSSAHLLSDRVICIGVPPMMHSKSDIWFLPGRAVHNTRILSVNSRIQQLCGDANFIDTPSFWSESDSDDGIHPNSEGYRKISARIKQKIPQ